MKQKHSGNKWNFEIKYFFSEFTEKLKKDSDLLIKTFSLQSYNCLKHIVLFGPDGKIKKKFFSVKIWIFIY